MNTYLLFKSIHLIAVISWMAGLLYLPRIFVYHSEAVRDNKSEDLMSTFKVMERRLFIYIMNPAMIVSWIFGMLLIHTIGIENFTFLWLQLKLLFVIILTIYHFFLLQCLEIKVLYLTGWFSPEKYCRFLLPTERGRCELLFQAGLRYRPPRRLCKRNRTTSRKPV